ncbi:hypothetical protein J7413_10320 [Shimia sp. R10_1]|uniref:flagellin n=1 Tax=Shimia sp. R10_1 TaxID=2821095 RepID=UPI001ADD4CA6|nr:flagellin [Shimia sp. R10_1]MBO9473931.1 hypothetical protein [Shimia sp. R10_1]
MPITSVGDMAQHLMMSRRNTDVKNNLNRLANELGSGRKSDVAASLKGDFNMLASVERQLTVLEGYGVAISDAAVFSEVAQASLKQVQALSGDLARDALSSQNSGVEQTIDTVARSAANDFESIVTTLNGRASDRNLFAGTGTDGAALVSADDMMTQIRAAVAGATSVSDIEARLETYFMTAGGGFETGAYEGTTTNLAPFRLNDTQTADFNVRADDPALRAVMRDTAMVALADDPGLNLSLVEKQDLMGRAGERLLGNQDDVISLQADIGFNQERIENAKTNNSAQTSALKITQNDLLSADATQVAGELQKVQVQLEMVYTITARLSQLTLANYVR